MTIQVQRLTEVRVAAAQPAAALAQPAAALALAAAATFVVHAHQYGELSAGGCAALCPDSDRSQY